MRSGHCGQHGNDSDAASIDFAPTYGITGIAPDSGLTVGGGVSDIRINGAALTEKDSLSAPNALPV